MADIFSYRVGFQTLKTALAAPAAIAIPPKGVSGIVTTIWLMPITPTANCSAMRLAVAAERVKAYPARP